MNSVGRDVALSAVRPEGSQLVAARLHEALIKNGFLLSDKPCFQNQIQKIP